MTKQKILVLDSNERSSLAVIRSLGKISEIKLFTADSLLKSIGGSSKYSDEYYQYPSISDNPNEFLDWIGLKLKEEKFDLIFPCTEISSQLLLMSPKVVNPKYLPFATLETVMSLADKGKLTHFADSINIPCPKSEHYQSASQVDINKIKKFPVVIKPNLSKIWQGNSWTNTVVLIAKNKDQLSHILKQTPWLQGSPFMLQEFIEGYGAGLFALYDKGGATAFYAHKRLREKPPQGGVSVLSCSAPLEPNILKNAKKLLDSVKWHGVAMVEFRVAEDGTPYLMEVNTRFWGSLQLAIDSGVNFPELLYKITIGEKVSLIDKYNENNRLRWFLGDLDSLYLVLRSSDYSIKQKLKRLIGFFIPHFLTTRHQVGRWNDWKPAVEELRQYLRNLRR